MLRTAKIKSMQIFNILFNVRTNHYGIQDTALLDNAQQFVEKIFTALLSCIEGKRMMKMAFHPHISERVERYYKMLVLRLRPYSAASEINRDIFVQTLNYT